jgi:23S rRNA (pseudouridine1915-N3)-methyltransferase
MIKIVCIGKPKENYIKDAIKEYKKRLTKYTKLEIIELESTEYDDINKNLKEESDRIIKYLNDKDYIITLDIAGKQLSSEELAIKIENILIQKNITFIIGGSNGLEKTIKNMSNDSLSFSKLTFPHQLFRVILLEQIYRSFKIINNESYHK